MARRFLGGLIRPFGILLFIVLLSVAAVRYESYLGTAPETQGSPVLFQVKRGEGAAVVGQRLASDHLVRNALYFEWLARLTGKGADIKAGYYLIPPTLSSRSVLARLVSGKVATRKVTIPEGFTVAQIAGRLAAAHATTQAAFMAAAAAFKNPYLPPGADVLNPAEGYLFPSTYEIPYGMTANGIIALMFNTFQKEVPASLLTEGESEGLDPNGVVTLASIVEREASIPSERAEIAAVFINRMKRHMPLGSDATLDYALKVKNDNLTKSDMASTSPYNTLKKPGLPPGPIAVPGLASIQAALHPANVKYLYFYGLPNGSHVFSYTYAQQLAVERKYATK